MLYWYLMKNLLKFLISTIGCELVGLVGTPFTISSVSTWYAYLNKPVFSPPNWVFGPVWTILYFMMGVSFYLIWEKGLGRKKVKKGIRYFAIQLILNFSWSGVFFGLHQILSAFLVIVALWIFIFLTIIEFYKVNKTSAYLLLPYIAWVSFASVLNLAVFILNQ